jgi:hypothetical protein
VVNSSTTRWMLPDDLMSIRALRSLGDRLKIGRACALVGAGVAAQLGYPTWTGLLDQMGAELANLGATAQTVNMLAAQKDTLWRAEEYRRLMTEKRYKQFLRTAFSKDRAGSPIPASLYDIIGLNWKHVFTTNYDHSLQLAHRARYKNAASELEWQDRDAVREFLASINHESGTRLYIHLHGDFQKPENIVLSYQDYVRRYVQSDETVERLFVLFSTQCFAFIGFSLEDPDFVQILRQVNSRLGSAFAPAHFAILPASPNDPLDLERRRLVGKYDVEPIFYRHDPGDNHVHLATVVAALLELQDESVLPTDPSLRNDINEEVSVDMPEVSREGAERATLGDREFDQARYNTSDPQKSRWGGKAESGGRMVSAAVFNETPQTYRVNLSVTATSGPPLSGEVIFHLHHSFQPPQRHVKVEKGSARLSLLAYGAFTVGVETDGGSTRLELDLAQDESFPQEFRNR